MKSTNVQEIVRAYDILDAFCSPARGMLYEPIKDWEPIDAILVHLHTKKYCGIARIFSTPGNFGSKPIVELPKTSVDFMYELATLMGKAAAVIVKFRNKVMYWKIDRELKPEEVTKRGKKLLVYKLPINLLKNV